jgi:hypothetical protein
MEHLRHSLPYYLQRYELSRGLELRIDPDTLARLVKQGSGDLELSPDGRDLVLHEEAGLRYVHLDLSRRERREAQEGVQGDGSQVAAAGSEGAAGGEEVPVGVDGRPATIIPIKPD